MDPQAAWDQLLSAYAQGDWDVIEERATELLEWLDRGGFPPKVICNPAVGPEFNSAIVRAACAFALETVQGEWSIQE